MKSNAVAVIALLGLIAVIALIFAGAIFIRNGQKANDAATMQYWNQKGTDEKLTLTAQIGALNAQATVTFEAMHVSSTKTFAMFGATATKQEQDMRLLNCYDVYLTDQAKLDLCKSTGGSYQGATPIP